MNFDLVNHVNKCRCCFKSLNNQRKANKITEEIEKQFYEIVQIELISSELYSSIICDVCKKQLENAAETKEKFSRNQKILLKYVEEQKSPGQNCMEGECDNFSENSHEDTEESTVDQFDIDNVKWDEVVVKVEPVDFDGFCVKEAEMFEFFELPKAAVNKNSSVSVVKTVSSIFNHKIEKLPRSNSFIKHITAHKERSKHICFSCDQCDFKSNLKKSIKKHMNKHASNFMTNEKYHCNHCSKVYNSSKSLTVHENNKHFNIKFVCKCGKVYASDSALNRHKRNSHSNMKLQCQICVKFYPSKERLKDHFNLRHAVKSPCEICGKMVGPGSALRIHKRTVHGKKIQCKYEGCGKILTSRGYKSHFKAFHKPQESQKCRQCDAEFNNEFRLGVHMLRQHRTEKKPCQVPGCSHSTFVTSSLIMHYKNHKNISGAEKEQLISELRSKMR